MFPEMGEVELSDASEAHGERGGHGGEDAGDCDAVEALIFAHARMKVGVLHGKEQQHRTRVEARRGSRW